MWGGCVEENAEVISTTCLDPHATQFCKCHPIQSSKHPGKQDYCTGVQKWSTEMLQSSNKNNVIVGVTTA